MKVKDIFDLLQGNSFELINMDIDKGATVNFVARSSENNGVTARVSPIDDVEPFPEGGITVALSGSVLSSFVQDKPFYTGFHVMVLLPKTNMRLEEKLFYCHCIKMNAYRYGYGRQANKTLKDITLPPLPAWLKEYTIDYSPITTNIQRRDLPIDTMEWGKFRLGNLFEVLGTKTTKLAELQSFGIGQYPYVTTQASNNGIAGFYDFYTETGNVLVIDSAVAGFCSYQENHFSASDHVEKLVPRFAMNRYIGLFIVTLINRERFRYTYGRKCNQEKISNTLIRLPVDETGEPDWMFMEQYMKSLPYSDV